MTSVISTRPASLVGEDRLFEQHLPASLRRSRTIAVVVVDSTGTVVYANDAFADSLGAQLRDDVMGLDVRSDLLVDASKWQAWLTTEPLLDQRIEFRALSGDRISLQGELAPLDGIESHVCGVFTHVAEPLQMVRLMNHSARMEAVAGLSTGIAHDFNNLLTVLVGNLYLLGEELRENETAFSRIKHARDTALRGADLTRQLLNFARNEEAERQVVNPVSIIDRFLPLLEKLVGSKVDLKTRAQDSQATIEINPAQLESALVNLVINARDAIDGKGVISIDFREFAATESFAEGHGIAPGLYVMFSVTDDGPGIPTAVVERVFEPFYTTKPKGSGTGLGLSMVRWLARDSGGTVIIDSVPGRGATVAMLLPVSGTTVDETSSNTMPLSTLPSGEEAIVLSMADREILAMTQQCLSVLGYQVSTCESVSQIPTAISDESVELVVVDGKAADDVDAMLMRLQKAKSGVKVLVLTSSASETYRSSRSLRKPFSLAELAVAVRATLDGEPGHE